MHADGDLTGLVERLGLSGMPADLPLALVHRSYSYENGRIPTNERLEFLGDSVLGIVITDHLYRNFPDLPEGQLAKMRSAIVNAQSLAVVARDCGVGDYLLLGRGEDAALRQPAHVRDAAADVVGQEPHVEARGRGESLDLRVGAGLEAAPAGVAAFGGRCGAGPLARGHGIS